MRERSRQRRGLDDFARTFLAASQQRPPLYDRRDVVAALEAVQPYDWVTFLRTRVDSTAPAAPVEWLRRSGYRLVFTDTPTAAFASHEQRANRVDLGSSIG